MAKFEDLRFYRNKERVGQKFHMPRSARLIWKRRKRCFWQEVGKKSGKMMVFLLSEKYEQARRFTD